nr:MAG TPA: hypothetical protein [Caudoviricetes sp.]
MDITLTFPTSLGFSLKSILIKVISSILFYFISYNLPPYLRVNP